MARLIHNEPLTEEERGIIKKLGFGLALVSGKVDPEGAQHKMGIEG